MNIYMYALNYVRRISSDFVIFFPILYFYSFFHDKSRIIYLVLQKTLITEYQRHKKNIVKFNVLYLHAFTSEDWCSFRNEVNPRLWKKHVKHLLVVREVRSLNLGSTLSQTKYVRNGSNCCYFRCTTLIDRVRGKPWLKTAVQHFHSQLGISYKCHANKELVVCRVLLNLIPGCVDRKGEIWLPLVILGCWTSRSSFMDSSIAHLR